MTKAVPGEFAADALLHIAALDSVAKPRKVQLLEQAFQRAADAQEPLKRQPAITRVPGAAGFLTRAYSQNLDAMSLRLRVIAALEPLDPPKARALFLKIPAPKVPKLTCADFLTYNVAEYYQAMTRLAPQLIREQAAGITSPVQVSPVAATLAALKSDADFRTGLTAFSGALRKIAGDDRSFTFSRDVGPRILALKEESERRKISPLPLIESYRLYLVANEQTSRCSDDDLMDPLGEQAVAMATGAGAVGGEGVDLFNTKLRIPPIQPIQEQETTPTKVTGVAEGLRGCEDTSCQAISQQYNAMIFDPVSRTAYPNSRRNSPEWQDQMRQFLGTLAQWQKGTAITEAQYYRQKSAIYGDALNAVPAGPLQGEIVSALLDFAHQSEYRSERRIEWFLPLNVMIGRMALDPLSIGRFAGLVRESKDPVIALYSALESVAPRTPDKILALF